MSAQTESGNEPRTVLAFRVVNYSILCIAIISIVYLGAAKDDLKNAAQVIFNSTLPLFGTWVGTVLAYYFAKENFDSATKNTVALAQVSSKTINGLESILVSAAISDRFLFEEDLSRSLDKIKEILIENDRKRLPIINRQGRTLLFLAYFQDIDAFNTNQPGKSLGDFIQASPDKNKPVVFVAKDISLAKANEERKKIRDCIDIFVTENGTKDSKVIGYLTDFDIDRFSKT